MGYMQAMAEHLMTASSPMFEDRVTFQRRAVTKGSSGGNILGVATDTTADVPCRYRPASGAEKQQASKAISGVAYMIFVPALYEDELVDVDAGCTAVIAARDGGEVSRTFNVSAPLRHAGIQIEVLCSLEG